MCTFVKFTKACLLCLFAPRAHNKKTNLLVLVFIYLLCCALFGIWHPLLPFCTLNQAAILKPFLSMMSDRAKNAIADF